MAAKRGPSYPLMSLPECIEKVRLIYESEPHNEMTTAAAAAHLGYKSVSGASAQMIANLRKYGLLEGRKDQIRLSDDAKTILADEDAEDQSERIKALERAAAYDSLFNEIAVRFPNHPAEATLVSHLIKQGYRQDAARLAAKNYRETMEFVEEQKLKYTAVHPSKSESKRTNVEAMVPGSREVQIPLSADSWAVLSARFPLDEGSWEQMMAVLHAMKPALVGARRPRSENDADDRE